jgi:hypothetical protein
MERLDLFFDITHSENKKRIADGEGFVNIDFLGADGRNRTADLLITNQQTVFLSSPTNFDYP